MRAARVVLSAKLPAAARTPLAGLDVVEPASGAFDRAGLLDAIADADAAITLLSVTVDGALLDAAPRLRVIANFAVGTNNIDLPEATRRGVLITNTPDVLTDATADLAFGLLLAAARRFHEASSLLRVGVWSGWEPEQLLGASVSGATLGLIGFGRIGQAMARRARGFGMRIFYASPRPALDEIAGPLGAVRVPLEELLARADFVSLHLPLTTASHHLIGARELARMKPGAILINAARGPIVDEAALADALSRGVIFGCGLDVFEHEPAVHPGLLASPRAILVPHLGSATREARDGMARLAAEGVADALAGRTPAHLVNPAALENRRVINDERR